MSDPHEKVRANLEQEGAREPLICVITRHERVGLLYLARCLFLATNPLHLAHTPCLLRSILGSSMLVPCLQHFLGFPIIFGK